MIPHSLCPLMPRNHLQRLISGKKGAWLLYFCFSNSSQSHDERYNYIREKIVNIASGVKNCLISYQNSDMAF